MFSANSISTPDANMYLPISSPLLMILVKYVYMYIYMMGVLPNGKWCLCYYYSKMPTKKDTKIKWKIAGKPAKRNEGDRIKHKREECMGGWVHCPKNNLNLCRKTQPVTVGADAMHICLLCLPNMYCTVHVLVLYEYLNERPLQPK